MKFKVKSASDENAAGGFLPVSSASQCQASGGSQRGNQVTSRERERMEEENEKDKDRKHLLFLLHDLKTF